MEDEIRDSVLKSSELIKQSVDLSPQIEKSVNSIVNSLHMGNKVVIFGNGGSAADAQHMAAEFIGRFKLERESFPAISLTTDTSVLTSLSNDYSYEIVFSRQCESIVSKGDVVIGISTSGNSINVEKGLLTSKNRGAITIGLLGNKGGTIKDIVEIPIIVNSSSTEKIQEVHRVIYHIICDMVEKKMVNKKWQQKTKIEIL